MEAADTLIEKCQPMKIKSINIDSIVPVLLYARWLFSGDRHPYKGHKL
jgi:hypothetical protein